MLVRPIGKNHLLPWNKGLLVGQKKPLQPKHVWSIRVRLEVAHMWRDLALFNLAIDSKLRACDLVKLRVDEICSGARIRDRATIVQKKTGRPVQFEITEQTAASLEVWLPVIRTTGSRYLFPSRLHARPHLSTRQYSRLVHRWVDSIGLESISYGTHSMRRTKATLIYRKTGNLRAVQLLLGHTKLESTVRYLGIEVDDALNIAEQIELNRRPPASRRWVAYAPFAMLRNPGAVRLAIANISAWLGMAKKGWLVKWARVPMVAAAP